MHYDLEIQVIGGWIRMGFISLGGPAVMQLGGHSVPTHQFTLYASDILAIAEKLENPPISSSFGSFIGLSSGIIQIVSDGAFVVCIEADNITRSCATQLRMTADQAKELAAWLRSYIPKTPVPTWQEKARARRDKGLKGIFG